MADYTLKEVIKSIQKMTDDNIFPKYSALRKTVKKLIKDLEIPIKDEDDPELKTKKKDIENICRELNVKRMYAFGSSVKNDFDENSDIDFLISFSDDISIDEYSDNYFKLYHKLKELFHREVDIVTESSLSNPYFIESIDESKELIYEA